MLKNIGQLWKLEGYAFGEDYVNKLRHDPDFIMDLVPYEWNIDKQKWFKLSDYEILKKYPDYQFGVVIDRLSYRYFRRVSESE